MKRAPVFPGFLQLGTRVVLEKAPGTRAGGTAQRKSSTGGPALLFCYCVKGMCKSQQARSDAVDAVDAVDSGRPSYAALGLGMGEAVELARERARSSAATASDCRPDLGPI